MALETFTPPNNPDIGSSGTNKFRILEADFGDGYTQAAGDGINTREASYQLTWTDLDETDFDSIWDFFIARGGYEAFYYTLPNRSTAEKYRCKQFTETYAEGNTRGIAATFDKVYDL